VLTIDGRLGDRGMARRPFSVAFAEAIMAIDEGPGVGVDPNRRLVLCW
jgi:hypothetical protein